MASDFNNNRIVRLACSFVRGRRALLIAALMIAFALRVLAAFVIQHHVDRHDPYRLCVFPDSRYYWLLARAVRAGGPYEIVEPGGAPLRALRTPGYPVFLAACQAAFGESPLAVRLVQAVLGALSVWLVFRLALAIGAPPSGRFDERARLLAHPKRPGTVPILRRQNGTVPLPRLFWGHCSLAIGAALLAAIHPYYVGMSELILSEAVFMPLMLASLWGLSSLWSAGGAPDLAQGSWRGGWIALGTGALMGAAVLVRPSWALFPPAALVVWVAARRNRAAAGLALVIVLGTVVVMAPWWARNARIYGRFVPTALWLGASLYDGLGPQADGASDMAFLDAPDLRALDEPARNAELTRRALDFARLHPGRVLKLALIKLGRYWAPWPNADELQSRRAAIASAAWTVPLDFLIIAGAWRRRRDVRALLLLAGPVVYFSALHAVFVGSIRYRIPAEIAAMPLAAIGARAVIDGARTAFFRDRTA